MEKMNIVKKIERLIVKAKPSLFGKILGHKETIRILEGDAGSMNYALFIPEERNEVMMHVALDIEDYIRQKREVEVDYEKKMKKGFNEITKISINSKDGIIKGKVRYLPESKEYSGANLWAYRPDMIEARFNFNSNNPRDNQEYLDLVRIIDDQYPGFSRWKYFMDEVIQMLSFRY